MANSISARRSLGTESANPVGHAQMRTSNTGLVLRYLHDHGGRSRAALSAETGLSKASVSSIVADLVTRGLVCEGEASRQGRVGRPGTEVRLDGARVCAIGVELNVEYLMASVVDLSGREMLSRLHGMPHDQSPDSVLDNLAALIRDVLEQCAEREVWVAGIVVAAPGVIDAAGTTLKFAPNLGWTNVAMLDELAGRLGAYAPPIALENDAKLSALAAFAESSRDDVRDLVYLTGDVGVGAGIIADGTLVRGWSGFSGEVGHMKVHSHGRQCRCGRTGCWEMYVGLPVVIEATPQDSPARDVTVGVGERLEAVRRHINEGDARVIGALDDIAQELVVGISLLVDVLNPRMVVLGGYFGFFADRLLGPVEEAVNSRVMDEGSRIHIIASGLGMSAAAYGGALVALEAVMENPAIVPVMESTGR